MLTLLLALGCTGGSAPATLPPGDPQRPDIVLISIDSLRADHLSSYGYGRKTSPHLDELAARGLRFTQARSASPWTLPAHMTMLTGLWPFEHLVVEDTWQLAEDVPVIQERLREAGWATAGYTSTVYVSRQFGFARGFDEFDDFGVTEANNLDQSVPFAKVIDRASGFVGGLPAGEPAFLFLHTYDAHYPYLPPEPFNSAFDEPGTKASVRYRSYEFYKKKPPTEEKLRHVTAQYDECIQWVDSELDRLVRTWAAANRPAIWIITADHGEEFMERGSWGHAHTTHVEALHVPLIIVGPGVPAAVRDDPASNVDLAHTIAGLAGLGWEGDGRDLRGPVPADRPRWAETSRMKSKLVSAQQGPYRLDLDLARDRLALYDQAADPAEKLDVAAAHPDVVERLRGLLAARIGTPWSTRVTPLSTPGAFWQGGALLGHRLQTPGAFGLWPPNAPLALPAGGEIYGVVGAPSVGDITYDGPRTVLPAHLDEDTRKKLEALGYTQGEGGK